MLLEAVEKKRIAALLNARIDIPWVPESLEGPIFEHAVGLVDTALEGVLPDAFGVLMRDGSQGIDEAKARAFGDRLLQAVNKKIDLPYFDEAQEADLIKMVIEPLVQSMIDGESIDNVLTKAKARVG
jgi:hypothetical protein